MTNKIKYPWLALDNDGLIDKTEDNKDLARKSMSEDGFLAYAEPFEPIKITKDDVGKIDKTITNINNLGEWYNLLGLSDDQIAFLFLHRANWRDFVEIDSEKKYYLISTDAEKISLSDKILVQTPLGFSFCDIENSTDRLHHKTQFTQAEIDELGSKVSGLRKEEVE